MPRVTDAMEQRAQRRINSANRVALSQRAGRSPLDDEGAQLETLGREVGYCHSMLMQCFLRQKPIPADQREWRCRATRPIAEELSGLQLEALARDDWLRAPARETRKLLKLLSFLVADAGALTQLTA